MEKNFKKYLETMKSENTRKGAKAVVRLLEKYMELSNINSVNNMGQAEVDAFLKRNCEGKSDTTISNMLSRLRGIFKYFDNADAVQNISLNNVKAMVETRRQEYILPSNMHKLIEGLINYQDKALVLLIYLGLYDNEFETIKNIKAKDVKDGMIVLPNGTEFKLNSYSNNIIQGALKEEEMEKYTVELNNTRPYKINIESEYLIRTKKRTVGEDKPPAITLKKKFETYSKFTGIHSTPVKIKNSRILYDLVKLEYTTNLGMDINQIELGNMLKVAGIRGTIEQLNMDKKVIKKSMIKEIMEERDFFIN